MTTDAITDTLAAEASAAATTETPDTTATADTTTPAEPAQGIPPAAPPAKPAAKPAAKAATKPVAPPATTLTADPEAPTETTVTMASASSAGMTLGFGFDLNVPLGSGAVTVTPTGSTIGGLSSFTVPSGTSCSFDSDGSNFLTGVSCSALTNNLARITPTGSNGQIFFNSSGTVGALAFASAFDTISTTPGAIPYRSTGSWIGGTISTVLDTISTTTGSMLYRSSAGWLAITPGTSGYALTSQGTSSAPAYAPQTVTFGTGIDGGGTTISTGSKGFIMVPYSGTITKWYLVSDQSGSIVVDIKRAGTSIIGAGNKPSLSSAQSGSAAVSGWTSVAVTEGDIIEFSVTSATSVTHAQLSVKETKQ